MRQSSHSCLGLVFTLFDPPFNCSSSCCKDQFAVLYLIQTVKLVINVVILKLCRLCLHFNMHVLCLILVLRKVLSCYFMVSEHLCFFCLARFANRQINSGEGGKYGGNFSTFSATIIDIHSCDRI